jgi:hypothetical protein
MRCEDLKELFIEYIDGSLNEQNRVIVDEHLSSCEICSKEVEDIESLCLKLNDIELEEPSKKIRKNFDNMIDSYSLGMANNIRVPWHAKLSKCLEDCWPKRPLMQLAATIAVLVVGLVTGLNINIENESDKEIVQLKTDVDRIRQTVMSSLLNQSSVTERINGLTMTSRLENVDDQFHSTLLLLLNSDSNVNVRLAAVNALSKYADNKYIRDELANSLGLQSSPLVQIALIDLLSTIQEYDSYPALMRMINDPDTNNHVKKRAKSALTKLVSFEDSI